MVSISVIQTITSQVAEELSRVTGETWTRTARLEDENWRAEISGPGEQKLFLSNTWGGKGRLYISGSFPDGVELPYKAERPSITVAETKNPEQIAKDVVRRLLPPYVTLLAVVLDRKAKAEEFEAGRKRLAAEVAIVVNGNVKGEMVYSKGWDLQISGPDSIRINGNCNYLTLDQLKKIQAACPELFKGKEGKE